MGGRKGQNEKKDLISEEQINPVPDELQGVLISDELLKAKYPDPVITPLIFGDLDLSPPEIKALLLPPGFTTYDTVSVDKMEIASEAAVDKLRWNAREKEERGGEPWTEDW